MFLKFVLGAVPGLKLMLSAFGDVFWNCFTGTSGDKRTRGANQRTKEWTWDNGNGSGDDGDDGRPPWGWFWRGNPEDALEKKRKLQEWHEDIEGLAGRIAEVLNILLALHHQLGQPQKGGGPQPAHPPLTQQVLNLINALLAAVQQPLAGDILGNLVNWRTQVQALLNALPNDPANNRVHPLLRLLITELVDYHLAGMMIGYQPPRKPGHLI